MLAQGSEAPLVPTASRNIDLLLLLTVITAFMAALTSGEGAIYRHTRGEPIAWVPLVGLRLLDWSTCALLVPPMYALLRRLPHDRRFWRLTLPALLLAGSVAAVLKYVVHTPLAAWAEPSRARSIIEALQADYLGKVMFYWAVLGALYGLALQRGDLSPGWRADPPAPGHVSPPQRLLLRDAGGTTLIDASVIDWVEAQGNYCRIHSGPVRRLVRRTMASLLEELAPRGFVRVHRSRIVNTARVRRVEGGGGQLRLVLEDGAVIPVGRAFRAEVRRLLSASSGAR